jgi:hypothetical protein
MEQLNAELLAAEENFQNHGNREEYQTEVNAALTANGITWQWPTWPAK